MVAFKSLNVREKIAVVTSSAVLTAGVIYWLFQVKGMIELLQLAYG